MHSYGENLNPLSLPKRYLPQYAFPEVPYLPGRTLHPRKREVEVIPKELHLQEKQEISFTHPLFYFGVDLFNYAYWWESHECWEILWMRLKLSEKNLMQALIQMAACCLTHRLGRERGTHSLKKLVLQRLTQHILQTQHHDFGLNLESLQQQFLNHIEKSDPPPLIVLTPTEAHINHFAGEPL